MLLAVGAVAIVGLLILLVAVLAGGKDETPGSSGGQTQQGTEAAGAAAPHSAAAPLEGKQKAVFEVVAGAESLTIRSGDTGTDLYRVSSPGNGSLVPKATVTGDTVKLSMVSSGKAGGPATAEVILNATVTWQLKLSGGGMKEVINFSSGKLSGVELLSGAGEIDLTLPKATGTLAVKLSGGAGQFKVHLPQSIPVQVKVAGAGAGVVTIDGETKNAIKAGTTLAPAAWAKAANRYTIEAAAGVSNLVVDRVK